MATTTNNMSDETLLTDNALKGKIARLPAKIREEVCRRVHDGQPGSKLLPWLNALPEVKAIIDAQFDGVPVSDVNLSVWRRTGYQDWCKRRERVDRIRELSQVAADLAKAGGGQLAAGAANIVSGKILELLEAVDDATGKELKTDELGEIAKAVGNLRTTEQNDIRLKQNDRRLSQKDEEIALEKQKFQRDTAEISLKLLADDRARQIESGAGTNAEKIELLGQHIFGDLWKPTAKPTAAAGK